jgi:uncharacterized phage protein gp47/JayE
MSSFGVTSEGFVLKTLDDIKTEVEEQQRAEIDPGLNQGGASLLGNVNGSHVEQTSEVWEVAQAIYAGGDPDSAEGHDLDVLCAYTGVTRLPAEASTVTLTLTGSSGATVPAASVVSVDGNAEARFATLEDATLAVLTAWANTTAYTAGDRRTNASRAYECITSGTSAGSGGPTTTSDDITDGTAHWRYLGEGTYAVDVAAEAEETGPTAALSGALTEIETPVTGWESSINLLDAEPGRDIENDAELRLRRELTLATGGKGTPDAIRADVLNVDDVEEAIVFVNDTDTTDGDGLPPHSFQVVVLGGDDDEIAQAVWDSGPAGIQTYGGETGTAVDALGNNRTINFERPDEVEIYLDVTVTTDPDTYPADGDDQIAAALVAFGDTFTIGQDVVRSQLFAPIFSVSGVLDVTVIELGTAPTPSGTANLTIDARELAVFDTSRIVVTS